MAIKGAVDSPIRPRTYSLLFSCFGATSRKASSPFSVEHQPGEEIRGGEPSVALVECWRLSTGVSRGETNTDRRIQVKMSMRIVKAGLLQGRQTLVPCRERSFAFMRELGSRAVDDKIYLQVV